MFRINNWGVPVILGLLGLRGEALFKYKRRAISGLAPLISTSADDISSKTVSHHDTMAWSKLSIAFLDILIGIKIFSFDQIVSNVTVRNNVNSFVFVLKGFQMSSKLDHDGIRSILFSRMLLLFQKTSADALSIVLARRFCVIEVKEKEDSELRARFQTLAIYIYFVNRKPHVSYAGAWSRYHRPSKVTPLAGRNNGVSIYVQSHIHIMSISGATKASSKKDCKLIS